MTANDHAARTVRTDVLGRILAIAGTVLTGLPIIGPLALFAATSRLDWLMPAELFPAALIGGGFLLWAAIRARSRLKHIAWALGVAVVSLVGGQLLAVVTGLASGAIEAAGLPFACVVGSIALYALSVAAMCVGGVLLAVDLFVRAAGRPGGAPAR